MEFGCTSKGKLNRECVVLPPGNNVAAIPDDAVAKTIFTLSLKVSINLYYILEGRPFVNERYINVRLLRGYATTAATGEGHLKILEVVINGGASQLASEEDNDC